MSRFKTAGPAEIIRSHQKDDFYLGYLRGLTADVVHQFIGSRAWIKWRKEVQLLADLGYFILTTSSGYQTVGEEYVNIIQVDWTKRQMPSTVRRTLMVLLQVTTPYILRRILDWLEKMLKSPESHEIPQSTRDFLLRCIPVARTFITFSHRVHMAVFYLSHVFYHIAKRLSSVHYIQYNFGGGPTGDNYVQQSFKVLGWITGAQLLGSALLATYKCGRDWYKGQGQTSQTDSDSVAGGDFVPADRKCSLCLEERKDSSVTPCGHLFCWTCIHDWCQNKPECPLCREKFEQHRIVCLQNFDPT